MTEQSKCDKRHDLCFDKRLLTAYILEVYFKRGPFYIEYQKFTLHMGLVGVGDPNTSTSQRTEGRLNLNFQAHPYGVAFLTH